MKEVNKSSDNEVDNIEIISLLKEAWRGSKIILRFTIVFSCLGLFIAIFSNNKYSASTTFVPVNQGKSIDGNLGGLASLAGINLGSGSGGTEISSKLYPQIFNSIPYQLELLNTPLSIEGQEKITYREYYKNIYKLGLLELIKKYTIGLPAIIISSFKSENDQIESSIENQIINVSPDDFELINKVLIEQISLQVNEKEGFVSISVDFPEPLASAQFALRAKNLLQDYVLKFKTEKAKEQLNYIEARFLETKKEFVSARLALASFEDQNNGLNTALGRTKLLQLQSDYDLVFTMYAELEKQLETQRLQVKKDTPLFTVLKPVTVPSEKSGPKRGIILLIYMFVGIFSGLGVVFGRRYLTEFKKEWNKN